jgi:hypothetical protein
VWAAAGAGVRGSVGCTAAVCACTLHVWHGHVTTSAPSVVTLPVCGMGSLHAYHAWQQRQCSPSTPPTPLTLHLIHTPPPGGREQLLVTRLALDARCCLLGYHHGGPGPADVTFNLKDLRALLGLCEDMGANMGLAFSGPGAPLLAEPVHPPGHPVGGVGGWVGGWG